MLTVSDEAIDILIDRIDGDVEDLTFREEWLIEMRQFVRSWLEEHVTYRDITLPQLRTKREVVEEKFGLPKSALKLGRSEGSTAMGRDAQIAFTAKPSWDGTVLGDTDPEPAPAGLVGDAQQPTHWLRLPGRYYDEEYPRGPWPEYARILLGLFANLGITAVWYGHDGDFLKRIYPTDVLRISKYWMEHGWGKPQ